MTKIGYWRFPHSYEPEKIKRQTQYETLFQKWFDTKPRETSKCRDYNIDGVIINPDKKHSYELALSRDDKDTIEAHRKAFKPRSFKSSVWKSGYKRTYSCD